ncbi:MAG: alpha/beta hydrolase fold domain-containing protein [Planctomycetia bacterium]
MIHRRATGVLRRMPSRLVAIVASLMSATVWSAEFQPRFVAIRTTEPVTTVGVKLSQPVYNLTGWKRADGSVVRDVFEIGETIVLDRPVVTHAAEIVRWAFSHELVAVEAELVDRRLRYAFTVKAPGQWTVAYAGAPSAPIEEVVELFQPLVWNGRRLPEASFLIPDEICSIPGCLVQTASGTVGVMADPRQFPYEMPHGRNRRFGVTVRNRAGAAQPLVFAPFPGSPESSLAAGDSRRIDLVLVDDARPLSPTFETVARTVCGFRDRRENTLTSLNTACESILDLAVSPEGRFDAEARAFTYPDSAGTVKNVSALEPMSLAIVMDDERLFRDRGIPILEYLLSREKFLFALGDDATSSQSPSRRLAGPALPVSELVALHRLTGGTNPFLLTEAERLAVRDRTLNMDWVTPGGSWQGDLWLFRGTGDRNRLDRASARAEAAIGARIDREPTDFAEAGSGTFFDCMLPPGKELHELWLETRDPRHLAAAHKAARQYAQLVWFTPAVPEGDIVVNESGFAPRRGRPDEPGLVPVPRESVPAWRVSEQGLLCEGNGTVSRLAIYLATHAPWFMRLSHDASDPFLRDIARSAIVGRFAGFPGYHFNTSYSTAQEKPDFAQRPFEQQRVTTSMHYNHILPMAAVVVDYLFADAYARSRGAIDIPGEFTEAYAYLGGRCYGRPGRFYDQENVWPWMPRGLVTTDDVQVDSVAARGSDCLCVALMNQCGRPLDDVSVRLDLGRFAPPAGDVVAEIRPEGGKPSTGTLAQGTLRVSLAPHGLTAVVIRGLVPQPTFQQKLGGLGIADQGAVECGLPGLAGKARALRLCFGEQVTSVYAYLDCRPGDIRRARLFVDDAGIVSERTDDVYPFEFSVPDMPSKRSVTVRLEIEDARGGVRRCDVGTLAASTSLLESACGDEVLLKANGRLADVRARGPNPFVAGFPPPQMFHERYRVELVPNAAGLMVKADGEHERAEAAVVGFLENNYLPAIRKTMQLDEQELAKVRLAVRPPEDDLSVHEDITYNVLGTRALLLDLYTPKTRPDAPLPVVLFVHGGGWLDGSHRVDRPVAMSLAKKGFAGIAVEYRLGREARFPAAVWDVKAAVRWVRKNAAAYGLDPDRIVVAGGSAGGNIAGLVGVTSGDPRFEGDGQHRDVSSDVSGVISLDGAIGVVSGNWARLPEKDPWMYNEAIPLFHMIERRRCLPFLFVKGGRPLSAWIQAHVADSHSRHVHFRWPHAFECFEPAKDELVDLLAECLHAETEAGFPSRRDPIP